MRTFLEEYWPVGFGLLVVIAAVVFALIAGNPAAPKPAQQQANASGQAVDDGTAEAIGGFKPGLPATAEDFWKRLRLRQPALNYLAYKCPCCGKTLQAPYMENKNMFGGVSTDLMSIQLKAPADELGKPDFSLQLFNEMEITCPNDGGTFEYLDLSNFEAGMVPKLEVKMRSWKLADDAPELAAIPYDQWTVPERHLAHYFTLVRAGLPDYEIGWRVLAGAHAANFAVWHGNEYVVPSPVFYELAVLHMRRELDNPDSAMNGEERATTAIMAAELYRLLGRGKDALDCLALAEKEQLQEKQKQAIQVCRARVQAGDWALQRDTVIDAPAPPVGWYIDMMMPAINSHILEYREQWNNYSDPAEVARKACELVRPVAQ
jgi:hypothetical protein